MSVSRGRKEKTMPTNEERRKIAARLRNWESFRKTFRESPICAALDVLNVEGYLDWRGVCELLADLIEPEPERTCHFRNDGHGIMWCDAQGCDYDMDEYFPIPNYCPNCGAKVVE